MPTAKIIPKRILYQDKDKDFSIISCSMVEGDVPTHPQYHSITIKGNGMIDFKLNRRISCVLEPIYDEAHPYTYKFIGFEAFSLTKLDKRTELQSLRFLMTNRQAESCHDAYPHFVEMVLTGHETDIDYHKIDYVGSRLLEKYIKKIKKNQLKVKFLSVASPWGIETDEALDKIAAKYGSVDDFTDAIEAHPYLVMMDDIDWGFTRADKAVLHKNPTMACSYDRAEAACLYLLDRNEQMGNTRINASRLFNQFMEIAPESASYIYEAVTANERIYYEPERKYVSLKSTYLAECHIADVVKKKIANPHYYPMDWQKFTSVDGLDLTDEQSKILELACRQDVAILTSPGGCGKSTTTKAIVEMLEANHYSYTLLGPTGISVKRLAEATGRQARTVHMFLCTEEPVGDYLICDEVSMFSVTLLSALFDRVGDTTKIILIADPSQLASISCGNIVRDLLDSGIMPVANLTKVFRYNTSGIITIATDVRNGLNDHLTTTYPDYKFIQIDTLPIKQIEREYARLLASGYKQDEILILSPFNKGDCGSLAINNYIQAKFNTNPETGVGWTNQNIEVKFRIGDKVINKKNEYHMPLVDSKETVFVANGDIGRIVDIDDDKDEPSMVVRYDCGDCVIDKAHIGKTLLAYSISVHSCQGSQAKAVIVVCDRSHRHMISKNLVYTAVSRAQKDLVLIGDIDTISEGIKYSEELSRETWLREVLIK